MPPPPTPPVAGPRVLGAPPRERSPAAASRCVPSLIGDGDFASNSFFPYMSNSDLLLAAVRWLAREERTTPSRRAFPCRRSSC